MTPQPSHFEILEHLARDALDEAGLSVECSAEVRQELVGLSAAYPAGDGWEDETSKLWCSIDNDDSRDLDQLTYCESGPGDSIRVFVAIADVDAMVGRGGLVDRRAAHNTSTVYTPARNFPMLPVELSEDLTSLGEDVDRLAIVVQFLVAPDGTTSEESVYRAVVRNRAKLAYPSVGGWLDGDGELPDAAARCTGMDDQLRLQHTAATALRSRRERRGALQFQSKDAGVVFVNGRVVELRERVRNAATELIENFMISANAATTRFLRRHGSSTLQRVVTEPERWRAIVELAAEYGVGLPSVPKQRALQEFLAERRAEDPLTFPDLSLAVIKLMGRGEYVVVPPRGGGPGHFALGVRDYAHTTAPNRRYPDLVTQRMVKAALDGAEPPYGHVELRDIAEHCSDMEVVVSKLERRILKSAAALLLESRIGESFDAIVTGSTPSGTWVRLLQMPVEGKVVRGDRGLSVGKRLRVKLLEAHVRAGFLDFARV